MTGLLPNQVQISVSTMKIKDGAELGAAKRDDKGFYRRVPAAIIGGMSRNQCVYEPESYVRMFSPGGSYLKCAVDEGQADCEIQHPFLGKDGDLSRLAFIDATLQSHYVTDLYTETTRDGKYTILYMDMKPEGPYAQTIINRMEDPNRNASFSQRAIAVVTGEQDGMEIKRLINAYAIDGASMPGFEQTCKRYMDTVSANEALDAGYMSMEEFEAMSFDPFAEDARGVFAKQQGCESITHGEIVDMLGCNEVQIVEQCTGIINPNTGSLITKDGVRSVFHSVRG